MCEYFINEFVERTINKLPIYKVRINGKHSSKYYLRSSNEKDLLDEIRKKLFYDIRYHWVYFTYDNYGFFYYDENKEIQFCTWNEDCELKIGETEKEIKLYQLMEILENRFRELLEVYLKSKQCRIEITELKIE